MVPSDAFPREAEHHHRSNGEGDHQQSADCHASHQDHHGLPSSHVVNSGCHFPFVSLSQLAGCHTLAERVLFRDALPPATTRMW